MRTSSYRLQFLSQSTLSQVPGFGLWPLAGGTLEGVAASILLLKDYADGSRQKTMKLEAVEFLRRFLMHTLPKGFMRIRHYGFMSNRFRTEKLERCRQLLRHRSSVSIESQTHHRKDPTEERPISMPCPQCRCGTMRILKILEPVWRVEVRVNPHRTIPYRDSS